MIGLILKVLFWNFLWAWIALAILGFIIGSATKSQGAKIVWWIFIFTIVIFGVSASNTMVGLDSASRLGVILDGNLKLQNFAPHDSNKVWFASIIGLMLIYSFMQRFGSASRNFAEQEENELIEAMSVDELVEAIELTLSETDVCMVPWVQNQWNAKSREDKLKWVDFNQDDLKIFVKDNGGFDKINETKFARSDFVVEVQRLDRANTNTIA